MPNYTKLDAWGQRENELPEPVEKTETRTVEVTLCFEYDPNKFMPVHEWIWEDLLDLEHVKVTKITEK